MAEVAFYHYPRMDLRFGIRKRGGVHKKSRTGNKM